MGSAMADVFVSYAKADRPLASKLVAMLEAEGWKVWWDTSLTIGDDFRNEIITELGRARAVIVIWTDASIKSDWVRSEAGRAQADRKLIPVKLEHLNYKDLPPPFDVLHTENVGDADKIRAAVIAQLAKPAVEPSATTLLTKGFKYELLTWFGIVGGALTLFTATSTTLKVADWVRLLVASWKEWTHAFWLWAFGWVGIHLSPDWSLVLSYLSFGSLLTIGQAVKSLNTPINQSNPDKYYDRSFRLASRRTWFCLGLIALAYVILANVATRLSPVVGSPVYALVTDVAFLGPQVLIVLFARHKLHAAISVVLLLVFAVTLVIVPTGEESDFPVSVALAWGLTAIVLPVIILSVAPAKAVSRRLIFLAIGLVLLLALNELSKLGLDVTAPKPHD